MSLTSYRAAPPRGGGCCGPGSSPGHRSASGSRGSPGLSMVMSLTSDPPAPPRVIACVWAAGSSPRESRVWGGFGRPGGDLLFRALRRSTIGAEGFHGRVRDGIGCLAPRYGLQAVTSRASPGAYGAGSGASRVDLGYRHGCAALAGTV